MRRARDVVIDPMPKGASGVVPWVGAGLQLLRDPTGFFTKTRERLGDTFVVDAFGFRKFCVFSAEGVRALYALPEREASFGLATYQLIKLKLPPELLVGRRNAPHHLFGNQSVEGYLRSLEEAHYDGRKLTAGVPVATKELVSTFGHGSHSCPAARFSISAIRIAVRSLLETYDLTPQFAVAEPRQRQIGGVARAQRPVRVAYRARTAAPA